MTGRSSSLADLMRRLTRLNRRIPIHPWLLAAYPILQLAAFNITQIHIAEVPRSLLVVTVAAGLGFGALYAILRSPRSTGLVLSAILVLFFSYGHVYAFLKEGDLASLMLGRHRYLAPMYALLFLALLWGIRGTGSNRRSLNAALNVLSVGLLIVPICQISFFIIAGATAETRYARSLEAGPPATGLTPPAELPDIYYIILDGYTRSDALKDDLGYDNSEFQDEMQLLGFYVAECSRSNYKETSSSLTSSLNFRYMSELREEIERQGLSGGDLRGLLKHSEVRRILEALGYQTVSFQTGYVWSEMEDADYYLALSSTPLLSQRLTPFESLLLETTAAKILFDYQHLSLLSRLGGEDFRHRDHVDLQLFVLDQLPRIAKIPGPTFTFAHILIPHPPIVFGPGGEILTDPGFYSGKGGSPINETYLREGYTGEIAFINRRIANISRMILETSDLPPILIIQGDHGLRGQNRFQILNLYHFPDGGSRDLYPTITPVNTFRVMFNVYFDGDYPLMPDLSHDNPEETIQVKEPFPCPPAE